MTTQYTSHARDEMRAHHVSEDDVEVVLGTYFERRFDKKGNRRLIAIVDGRVIAVVVARGSQPPRIITVWTEGRIE